MQSRVNRRRPSFSPTPLRRGAGGVRSNHSFSFLFALLLVPLIWHGCHKDDVDHEPGFILPPQPPISELPPVHAASIAPHRR